jgi:hypothetical protein
MSFIRDMAPELSVGGLSPPPVRSDFPDAYAVPIRDKKGAGPDYRVRFRLNNVF